MPRLVPPGDLPRDVRRKVWRRKHELILRSPQFWCGVLLGIAGFPLGVWLHTAIPVFIHSWGLPGFTLIPIQFACGAVILLPLLVLTVPVESRAYLRALIENHRCIACGYDLTANTTGVCPECGAVIHGRSRGG